MVVMTPDLLGKYLDELRARDAMHAALTYHTVGGPVTLTVTFGPGLPPMPGEPPTPVERGPERLDVLPEDLP